MMPWVATLTAPPSPVAPSVAPTMSGASIEEPMLLMKPPPPPIDWTAMPTAPAPVVWTSASSVKSIAPPEPFAPPPRRRPFTEADWPLLSIPAKPPPPPIDWIRSEEHTSELQSLMRISYAVFCLKKKQKNPTTIPSIQKIKPHIKQHTTHT